MRKSGSVNQAQVNKMETFYKGVMKSKKASDYNIEQLNYWAYNLDIHNSTSLLDTKKSRQKIKTEL